MDLKEILSRMTAICIVGLGHPKQVFAYYAYKDINIPLTKKENGLFEFEDGSTCNTASGDIFCRGHNMHIGHIKRGKAIKLNFEEPITLQINKIASRVELRRHDESYVRVTIRGWRYARSPLVVSSAGNKICLEENPLSAFASSLKAVRLCKRILTRRQSVVIDLPLSARVIDHSSNPDQKPKELVPQVGII